MKLVSPHGLPATAAHSGLLLRMNGAGVDPAHRPPLGQVVAPATQSVLSANATTGALAVAAGAALAIVAGSRNAKPSSRGQRRLRRCNGQRRHQVSRVSARAHADAATAAQGQSYLNVTGFPFPLGPIFARRTVRTQVGDGMWTFEQEQSLANIAVNVRMTVIRLECGGLWVHNPIAPTEECVALMEELGLPVKYAVLGSTQYEHKIFVGPFSRRWPEAKVYVVNQQWSWPLDLPTAALGIFAAGELEDTAENMPWAGEIDQRVFRPSQRLGAKVGLNYSAAECAFFHKRSKTLLCTDALVYIPESPPAVLDREELKSLGRDNNIILDVVALTNWRGSGDMVRQAQREETSASSSGSEDELLRRGWQRDALLSLYFGPDGRSILDPQEAFGAVSGRWIVGPVCYALVYGGELRKEVLAWTESFCQWDFQQILPSHFAGPVAGTPDDVRRAFQVLEDDVEATEPPEFSLPWPFPQPVRYRAQDLQLLTDIRNLLRSVGVI